MNNQQQQQQDMKNNKKRNNRISIQKQKLKKIYQASSQIYITQKQQNIGMKIWDIDKEKYKDKYIDKHKQQWQQQVERRKRGKDKGNSGKQVDTHFQCKCCKQMIPIQKCFSFGCKHYQCESCLHNYIIDKVQRNYQVECTQQNCHTNLNISSLLFMSLPGQIQKKYRMFCFKAALERMRLSISQEDTQQNTQFEKNKTQLGDRYRTCKHCKKILQKQALIYKLICQCNYQYCYLCQKKWQNNNHQCQYLIAIHQKNIKDKTYKFMLIMVMFALWMVLIFGVLMPRVVIKGVMYLVISVASGMTFYACMYVWKQQKIYKKVILLILYPISLIIGVGMASTIFFTTLLMQQKKFIKKIKTCLPEI